MGLPGLVVEMLVPSSLETLTWWGIGGGLARSFGKKMDRDIQETAWFMDQSPFMQNIVKRLLDFLHHWWAGALLMLYGPTYLPQYQIPLYWVGAGILVDDLPDLYKRVMEMLSTISEYMET